MAVNLDADHVKITFLGLYVSLFFILFSLYYDYSWRRYRPFVGHPQIHHTHSSENQVHEGVRGT